MSRILGMITLVLLTATLLLAHDDEKHVMGTVTTVTDSSVTVKDTHGKSFDVAITSTTKFMKNDKALSAKDIHPRAALARWSILPSQFRATRALVASSGQGESQPQ